MEALSACVMARPAGLPLDVVIPTLDEESCIESCLASVASLRAAGARIVVSDGGSRDRTVARARAWGAQVLRGPPGRARQMNAGAAATGGELLAFLHADTRPSPAACARLAALARRPEAVWGRFDVRLSGAGAALRVVETAMNLRSRLTGIATGDQLVFVSRSLLRHAGGFPDIALMEDVALSSALRRLRPPLCLHERVETSSRKWRREGLVRTVLLMWALRLRFFFGADPAALARAYRRPAAARRT